MKTCTSDFAGFDDFNLGHLWAVNWEHTLDAFTVGDLADREGLVQTSTFMGDDDAGEDLDTLLVAFDNSCVDFDAVTHFEGSDFLLELFGINFGDDVAHNVRGEFFLAKPYPMRGEPGEGQGLWMLSLISQPVFPSCLPSPPSNAITRGMIADYLLIDVGNGRTKLGLATRDAILDRRDLPTHGVTADLVRQTVAGWDFQQTVLCSVVPAAVRAFREALPRLTVLSHETPLGIGIRYPKPESIGTDRLANAVALAHLHGAPGVVIDFGTAVTFDILSADRHYIGGVIAPGLRLMTDYLHERTALLPQVELKEPETAIGQSTIGAIQAGAAIGYRGMIKGILEALRQELPPGPLHIVATGGDAGWIMAGMPDEITVDPDLTLHGLRLVGNLRAPSHV